jgi:hypothetical protein
LKYLEKKSLYANLQKCDFYRSVIDLDKIIFLGYVVSTKGIKMDEAKVEVI